MLNHHRAQIILQRPILDMVANLRRTLTLVR
jgi:hypothetical protein